VELVRPARLGPWRWAIVALIASGVVLNYLSRNALGVLAPQLETGLGLTARTYSYVVGAFQLAYAAMQPLTGALLDGLGLKLGVALFAAVWGVASMMQASAAGWPALAGWRALLGVGEAAGIPGGVKAVGEWFAPLERSVAIGWFNAGTSLGAVLAPPLVVFLALRGGFRSAFLATGALGVGWAVLWLLLYPSAGGARPPRRWAPDLREFPQIVRSHPFVPLAVARFLIEPAWQTFGFWIPLYLVRDRGMAMTGIALFAWLPFLAADAGGVLGGYLSPLLVRRLGLGLAASRVAGVALGAALMIAPGCVGLTRSAGAAIALFCVGGFAHQMISGLINTLTADCFPAARLGAANGLIGMCGWIGGLSFSLAIGALAGVVGFGLLFSCLPVFDLAAAAVLVAALRGAQPRLVAESA
jgi:ACS family hexuronate transporter-like MFS transporter